MSDRSDMFAVEGLAIEAASEIANLQFVPQTHKAVLQEKAHEIVRRIFLNALVADEDHEVQK